MHARERLNEAVVKQTADETAALAMSLSSVSVIANALRLRGAAAGKEAFHAS